MKAYKKHRNFAISAGVFVLVFSFLFVANAAVKIDVNTPSSIKIEYIHDTLPIVNAKFKIYRVADVSESLEYSLVGDFKDYHVNINGLDAAGYAAAANTLAAYVKVDNISPLRSAVTNIGGALEFNGLSTGLYLIIGEKLVAGDSQYSPIPVLVSLPSLDSNNNWAYNIIINPKVDVEPKPDGGLTYQSLRVIKVWDDDANRHKKRPKSVKIQLVGDGEVFDSVILNADNSWTHTWQDLDSRIDWLVIEQNVPQGYTVIYTSDKTIFKVQNTYEHDSSQTTTKPTEQYPHGPTGTTKPAGTTSPTGTTKPTGPADASKHPSTGDDKNNGRETGPGTDGSRPDGSDGTDDKDGSKLPQTGQPWWPVPVFATFGLLFFGVGWYLGFGKKKNEE
ncbi:MAG: Cna B-type domain-containing protein [Clostridiales bacterium]|jgi:hypothetical protein|nr:Cna B-type domain-containing protein [Clostridiales bacterium]